LGELKQSNESLRMGIVVISVTLSLSLVCHVSGDYEEGGLMLIGSSRTDFVGSKQQLCHVSLFFHIFTPLR